MLRILICVSLLFSTPHLWAQEGGDEQPNMVEKYGPRRQISTIVYMGLAGAVLGLSTLSFYGRPQDKLTNIPIGFGLGVIIGTVYMTYQAAANPDEFYRETKLEYQPQFLDLPVEEVLASDILLPPPASTVAYGWEF